MLMLMLDALCSEHADVVVDGLLELGARMCLSFTVPPLVSVRSLPGIGLPASCKRASSCTFESNFAAWGG